MTDDPRTAASKPVEDSPATPSEPAPSTESTQPPKPSPRQVAARRRYRRSLIVCGALALVLLVAAAVLPVPYVIVSPGPVFNTIGEYDGKPVIKITGTTTYPTTGELNMTTVRERGGPYGPLTAIEAVVAYFNSDVVVLPKDLLFPPGQSDADTKRASTADFSFSQSKAVAAAMKHLNIPVVTSPAVSSVNTGGPSDGKLQPGDVIKTVNGTPVTTREQLVTTVRATKPGTTLKLGVKRKDGDATTDVVVGANPKDPSQGYLGVSLENYYQAPFPIEFSLDGVGGPSAGLMFTLGTIDELTPGDIAGGKDIAGTGTIDPEGKVGAIGGIRQKMIAARGEGATLFLAPRDNCREVVGQEPEGLTVAAVGNVDEALKAIDDYRAGRAPAACQAG